MWKSKRPKCGETTRSDTTERQTTKASQQQPELSVGSSTNETVRQMEITNPVAINNINVNAIIAAIAVFIVKMLQQSAVALVVDGDDDCDAVADGNGSGSSGNVF
ncbi:unnamed protein product [Ceratitis capitata]|uniref:(Mediterranean fruit fly) hypothetical protein n=1 Tax=Ceratitis capitata TaxID=7213 RepID=A0A811U1D8_CERCA|nr:unnamed protein product [Ceratitis capitata]